MRQNSQINMNEYNNINNDDVTFEMYLQID